MHEHRRGLGPGHQRPVHLVGGQRLDALGPDLLRLAHAHPHVGVDHVGAVHRVGVLAQGHAAAAFRRQRPAARSQRRVRPVGLGRAGHKIQPHLGAADHQAVAHVVPRVAQVGEFQALQGAELLPQRQKIRQDLGGVELVGQAVPHRHVGVLRQFLHDLLPEAPVLDALEHARKHLRRVRNGLLLADLAARGVQVGGAHPQVAGRHLKGAARAGGGLFKDQCHILAPQYVVGHPRLLFRLQCRRQIQQIADLLRRVVQQRQKIAPFQIHTRCPLCKK